MDDLMFRWLPALAALAAMLLTSRKLVHDFQLESYQFTGYFRTLKRNLMQAVAPGCVLFLIGFTMTTISVAMGAAWMALLQAILVAGVGVILTMVQRKYKAKKPLVFTPRVKRLYAAMAIMETLVLGLCAAIPAVKLARALVAAVPLIMPLFVILGAILVYPLEKLINWLYLRQAKQLLREQPDLITIGVTGSYGKTSTKFILGTILREKYQTLVPPSSFNTPMGLTRVIRGNLRPTHQVFVAEMGARHPRDIKDLCRLTHPKYGVLTSVGPQHLDTFKTIERITETKYDLMRAVPEDGVCFFQNDEGICRELYDRTQKNKRLCSIHPDDDADVWAEDIAVSPEGSSFMLCTRSGSVKCVTQLLGEHNIQNILLSAMVALELGLSLKQIANGIAKLQPVEHRLQLISNPGGVTVIDDAFNSNPVSSELALRLLKSFPGRHIVITPGMVELGDAEAEFNRELGGTIAETADVAILVGKKHTRPIMDGALEKGFPLENIRQVDSLAAAAELLRELAQPGDVVLFENDLPDNYTE